METKLEVKGKRINLGAGRTDISEKNGRIFNFIAGFLFLAMTIIIIPKLLNESESNFADKLLPLLYLAIAIFYLGKASIAQSKTSKYAPHFIVSENVMKIKTSVFKKSEFINWDDVKKVEFGKYKIGIKDKVGLQYYPYNTLKETSIELKNSIKAIAQQKGIEVENLLKR